jgi:hypothetical protein
MSKHRSWVDLIDWQTGCWTIRNSISLEFHLRQVSLKRETSVNRVWEIQMISSNAQKTFGLKTFDREGIQDIWVLSIHVTSCQSATTIEHKTVKWNTWHGITELSDNQSFCFSRPPDPTTGWGGDGNRTIPTWPGNRSIPNRPPNRWTQISRLELPVYRYQMRYPNLNHRYFPRYRRKKRMRLAAAGLSSSTNLIAGKKQSYEVRKFLVQMIGDKKCQCRNPFHFTCTWNHVWIYIVRPFRHKTARVTAVQSH